MKPWLFPINRKSLLKVNVGFPGAPVVVKNPPASAGETGSIPGLGRPHVPRRNWAPGTLEPELGCKRGHHEKPAGNWRVAPSQQSGNARTAAKTSTAKNKE